MGRWGDTTYESDSALDYFAGITDRIMREIYYLFSPEQIKQNTVWIMYVITTIEIVLLFDKNDIGSTSYFHDQEQAIKRWQETFFAVWDAEWDDPKNTAIPFHAHIYRQTHRRVASKWFDRLAELAAYFSDHDIGDKELSIFAPDERTPYFSDMYSKTNFEDYRIYGFVLDNLIKHLKHSIVFVLSDENRKLAIGFFEIEDVWVAVDVMALLCETYARSPEVTYQTVEIWQKKTIDIWKARLDEESMEEDESYKNMMVSFDKLKEAARKFPPWFAGRISNPLSDGPAT